MEEDQPNSPIPTEVAAVAMAFGEVVPPECDTHCALVSTIAVRVLRGLGVECNLLPCQLWYAQPGHNHVVGFTGDKPPEGKWDGHVVCAGPSWIIDAAVSHLRRDVGADVPRLIAGTRFELVSQIISRFDIGPTQRAWWVHAPPGFDLTPPTPDEATVRLLSDALYDKVRATLRRDAATAEPQLRLQSQNALPCSRGVNQQAY